MNICEHLTQTARLFPERDAVRFEGRSYSFEQLDGLSAAAADHLASAGVGRGDRVALMLPNVPAFIVWYYGVLRLGGVAVSISTRSAETEAAWITEDCGARVFIASGPAPGTLPDGTVTVDVDESGDGCDGTTFTVPTDRGSWVETDPDEAALILYTSGTTGFPKGATLSHMNVRSNVNAFNHLCNMQPHDRILLAVPLFHCFGQNALLNSGMNAGATLVLQRRFGLDETRRLITTENVSQLYGVPMMFQLFLDRCEQTDLESVNYCFSAAAPLPIQVSLGWREKFGLPINEGYGLTETSPFASYNHRIRYLPGSIGTPIDGVEMRIEDPETGSICPPGQLGEIVVRGPNVMLGYWNRDEETRAAIQDGWFHTGDIGRVDEQGFFHIVDRVKDMIAVGGLKVYPAEVERVLLDHASVAEAAVVGIPDDLTGEQVVSFVVLRSGEEGDAEHIDDIRQHAIQNLADYKVPRQFVPIEELPRNPSGKILKTNLRQHDLSGLPAAASTRAADAEAGPGRDPAEHAPVLRPLLQSTHPSSRRSVVLEFVQELVRRIGGTDERPSPETSFTDAGLDSLMIVEMSHRLQAELGPEHTVQATLVFDHPRIADLADYLLELLDVEPCSPETQPTTNLAKGEEPPDQRHKDIRREIASMSEDEALAELMRELED